MESALSPNLKEEIQSPGLKGNTKQDLWVDELEAKLLVRRMPGGMIWLHSPCRNKLREMLPDIIRGIIENEPENEKEIVRRLLLAGGIHKEIGEWYERVLDASETRRRL